MAGVSWHDKLIERAEQQEEDLRLAEEQMAVVAPRPVLAQSAPQQAQASAVDTARDAALDTARKVVGALAAQSREHPGVGWSAGVYRAAGQTVVVATSNEGLGYIPQGVMWDRSVLLVFDPAAPLDVAMSWLGLADPARIVAGHFLCLSASRGDVELLALASTWPVGGQVSSFLDGRGTLFAERVSAGQVPQHSLHRAEAVLSGVLDQARSLSWWQRWNVAVALLRDAASWANLEKTYPQLYAIARELAVYGRADWGRVEFVEQGTRELPKQYQTRRVTEDRLGPVADGRMDEDTVLPQGGIFAYAAPFYAARICGMLAIMLRARAADEPLAAESLADIAYEHYSTAQNIDTTREIIGRGLTDQQQEQHGGAQ